MMPNPSIANPIGEGGLPEFINESQGFALAISMRFKQLLPIALGIQRSWQLDSNDQECRQAALEQHWRHLMSCQNFTHGFWIEPLLTPEDIAWYCGSDGADTNLCHQMISYLVASFCLLFQFHDQRQQLESVLYDMFRPLRRKTCRRLVTLYEDQTDRAAVAPLVDQTFWTAVQDYDALKFWPTDAHFPLGSVADFGGGQQLHPSAAVTTKLERPYMPFPLFAQRRLESLIRTERARLRHIGQHEEETQHDVLELYSEDYEVQAWHAQEEALLSAIDQARESVTVAQTISEFTDADPVYQNATDIMVDGEPVSCVDMATLGQALGKSPQALRQQYHRGRLDCIKHEGLLYFPTARIPEQLAASFSDASLGEILGVHRNTVREWRSQVPEGLSAVELTKYLWRRAGKQ